MGNFRFIDSTATAQAQYFIEPNKLDEKLQPHLKGQMHDALWMITQQIRNMEFVAEDAGTPIEANFILDAQPIHAIRHRSDFISNYEVNEPLESQIERQPLICNLGLKLLFAKEFTNLLELDSSISKLTTTKSAYPIELTDSDRADINAMDMLMALERISFDGYAVYEDIREGNFSISGISTIVIGEFKNWVEDTYSIPSSNENSWSQKALEYKASIVPTENNHSIRQRLTANEYEDGRLDWFTFDRDGTADSVSGGITKTEVNIAKVPSPVQFKGMPSERWWEYEDQNIDLANIRTHIKDTLKLVSTEFVINYSNDWFVIPVEIKVGSIAEIDAIVVKDVFGIQTVVTPAITGDVTTSSVDQWNQFKFSNQGEIATADSQTLFLAPSVVQSQESSPIDKVHFLRDEMANLTWGIEKIVPGAIGGGVDGDNAWNQLNQYLIENLDIKLPKQYFKKNNAELAYQLMNSFAENWIPFIPARKDINATDFEIVYQRATYDRVLPTEPEINTGMKAVPRTSILKPNNSHLFINEEEISRSGLEVSSSFQRARGVDGSYTLWFGYKKRIRNLTDSSGLTYDFLKDKPSYSELNGVGIDVKSLSFREINGGLLEILGTNLDNTPNLNASKDFADFFTGTSTASGLSWPSSFSTSASLLFEAITERNKVVDLLSMYDGSDYLTDNSNVLYNQSIVAGSFSSLAFCHSILNLDSNYGQSMHDVFSFVYGLNNELLIETFYLNDKDLFLKALNKTSTTYLKDVYDRTSIGTATETDEIIRELLNADEALVITAIVNQVNDTFTLSPLLHQYNNSLTVYQYNPLVQVLSKYPDVKQVFSAYATPINICSKLAELHSYLVWTEIATESGDNGVAILESIKDVDETLFINNAIQVDTLIADIVLDQQFEFDEDKDQYMNLLKSFYGLDKIEKVEVLLKNTYL